MPALKQQEFAFSDKDFKQLTGLVYDRTGIVLADHKKPMVYSRLAKRLRMLGLHDFRDYIDLVTSERGTDEVVNFVNAITTNLTSFFREAHHFEHLGQHLKERTSKPLASGDKRIRIWSAGCSSGMEPYSIAMTVLSSVDALSRWDIKILATDIDTNMLDIGSAGIYPEDAFSSMDAKKVDTFTKPVTHEGKPCRRLNENVRELIAFKRLNLLDRWPMKGSFDIIFCRNVVIYFDKETQRPLFNRYADIMRDDGLLYIGHSENLHTVSDRFELLGRTIYKRIR